MVDERSWKKYQLDELLEYEQPTPFIVESTDYNDAYSIPVLTAGKSFILGKTNERTGIYTDLPVIIFDDFTTATQFVNFPFKVKSSAMKILSANTKLILPKFAYYLMQTIKCEHSTHKRYWIQEYSQIQVSVPSLPEQERIVARIEELFSDLDKGVETLQTIKAQLKVYRQAVLKEAFEGKLTSEWREKNKRSILPKFQSIVDLGEDMPALPESWQYVCLSQLGDLARGKSKHRPRNDEILFKGGSYPFVQTGDIKAANKFLTTYSTMYNEVGLKQSKLWPINTLCITIAANIAETAFLGIEACFPDSIVGFTANPMLITKEYVGYFIQSAKVKLWAFAPATAQKNINLGTLENLYVPYCHYDEQLQIVMEIESRLSVCDKIEQTVDESLAKAENLRQSILKKAFEGRL